MKARLKKYIEQAGWHFNRSVGQIPPISIVRQRAYQESADFIMERLGDAVLFDDRQAIQNYIIGLVQPEGLLMEFGVFRGNSIRRFANALTRAGDKRRITGFDSFEGLEENWSGQVAMGKGAFDTGGQLPKVPANARLIKGWVQDTLPPFLQETRPEPIAFMHMDMDTYTPSRLTLELTKSRCGSGTIILFDEMHGYPNWQQHEYKALNEIYDSSAYEWLAFSNVQAAIRLK